MVPKQEAEGAKPEDRIERDFVQFIADSQLLAELGEALVATPSIAISELVKNAYDADAKTCVISRDEEAGVITIADDGHGITLAEFKKNWMTIATPGKRAQKTSRTYKRPLTGAKGVGRFAARFLGMRLVLESYAYDPEHEQNARLKATFEWPTFELGKELTKVSIPYEYELGVKLPKTRTTLAITELRHEWTPALVAEVREEVLGICSPLPSLDPGPLDPIQDKSDPGFSVIFKDTATPEEESENVAKRVLERPVSKLVVKVEGSKGTYIIEFPEKKARYEHAFELGTNLVGPLRADIRWMPWGSGIKIEGIKATVAQRWVRRYGGVKIIDHGFRLPPYGDEEDDWLRLGYDSSKNTRRWRSTFAERLFPSDQQIKEGPESPFLKLPRNSALVGAVFVRTDQTARATATKDAGKLQTAMDRSGFVENPGFWQLVDVVRGGLELVTVHYNELEVEAAKRKPKEKQVELQEEVRSSIEVVARARSIAPRERKQIVRSIQRIEKKAVELQSAREEAMEAMELVGLLGSLAAFMTHETDTLIESLDRLVARLKENRQKLKTFGIDDLVGDITQVLEQLEDQREYAKTFIAGAGQRKATTFKARPQVQRVIEKMESFTEPRKIVAINNVPPLLVAGPTYAVAYSGVVMNLYTNAIKALVDPSFRGTKKVIHLEAENEPDWHIIRVSDTGIGIPSTNRDRIFEPFFTTTKKNPLGSGMGLGLSIVKRMLKDLGGTVELVAPKRGYSTTFEVRWRR